MNKTQDELKTIAEIKANYRAVKTSWTRGYVSRQSEGVVLPYSGKYGEGYKVLTPSFTSTRYCFVTYYVK